MRVGIGVTTYNRPECLKECLEHINKHTFMDNVTLYVATDSDFPSWKNPENSGRKGVAYRKNECLRALKDCDYVFLFDDDCFPIKDGWVEFFTGSKLNHLLFLNESHNKIKKQYKETDFFGNELYSYADCGGVFMFMTKDCIERVGAFNEKFILYGFEHCEWSMRANKGKREFYCLENTKEYIFSHDYSTPNHKSSITDEEKKECIKNNWDKFFNCEIKSIHLPL